MLSTAVDSIKWDSAMDSSAAAVRAAEFARLITQFNVINATIARGGEFCWDTCGPIASGQALCSASDTVLYGCDNCTHSSHSCTQSVSCTMCSALQPPPPPPPQPPPPPRPSPPPSPPMAPPPSGLPLDIVIVITLCVILVLVAAAATLWYERRSDRMKARTQDAHDDALPTTAPPLPLPSQTPQRKLPPPTQLEMEAIGSAAAAG